jgi:hypothetical protein
LKHAEPFLNEGAYVFCTLTELTALDTEKALSIFREKEGITAIFLKEVADELSHKYDNLYAWITFKIHSSLEAVGLTAAFSHALAVAGIPCNVVAAFYHDHIFVPRHLAAKAMEILQQPGTDS